MSLLPLQTWVVSQANTSHGVPLFPLASCWVSLESIQRVIGYIPPQVKLLSHKWKHLAFQVVSLYSLYPCQASHTHSLISPVSPLYPCLNLCTQYPPLFMATSLHPISFLISWFAQVLYMRHTIIKNWFSYERPCGLCSLETGFSHLEYFFHFHTFPHKCYNPIFYLHSSILGTLVCL